MYLNQLLWDLNILWSLGWSSGWHTVQGWDSVSSKMMFSGPFWCLSIIKRSMESVYWILKLREDAWWMVHYWFWHFKKTLSPVLWLFSSSDWLICLSNSLVNQLMPPSMGQTGHDVRLPLLEPTAHLYKRFYTFNKQIQVSILTDLKKKRLFLPLYLPRRRTALVFPYKSMKTHNGLFRFSPFAFR